MAFDLASVLKEASDADKPREIIEYIDLDLIDPDPLNFYDITDLDGLAGSIELLGLQQPIRVRSGSNGHVTVVSGHRRRAACMMIRDGGSDMFDRGVPCIREMQTGSAALNELKLIYANSTSRVLSSSEISKQAERVTELLYQLKEEGIEFPGRMREHVAQACNVSSTKLARLHAIRENLIEKLLEHFDSGELSESAAYELQKLPSDLQAVICFKAERAKKFCIFADSVKNCVSGLKGYKAGKKCRYCDGECECDNLPNIYCATALGQPWENCIGNCCATCYRNTSCGYKCPEARIRVEKDKQKLEREKQKSAKAAEKRFREYEIKQQAEAQKLLPFIESAKLDDDHLLTGTSKTVKDVRLMAAGDFQGKECYVESFLPSYLYGMKRLTEELGCSFDDIYSTSDSVSDLNTQASAETVPALDTAPTWRAGCPDADGEYLALLDCSGSKLRRLLQYHESSGRWTFGTGANVEAGILGWYPIPDIPEE